MPDNFEKAKDEILRSARANGGVTVDHLFDALIATNADLDEQHQETKDWHEKVIEMVADHIQEAKVRDQRITKLEEYAEAGPELVKSYVQGYVDSEHAKRHKLHEQDMHSEEDTFRTKLVWFFATAFGKIALLAIGAIIAVALNYLF